ncbi:MAG: PQQ-binding-like beta-propeller repeat protein [Vicinamibacteria bacterium]
MKEVWRIDSEGFYVHPSFGSLRGCAFLKGLYREDKKDALLDASGQYIWQADLGDASIWREQIVDWRDGVVIRDLLTLAELRRFDFGFPFDNKPVCGDLVLAASGLDGPWRAFDLAAGRVIWERARPVADTFLGEIDWASGCFLGKSDRTIAMFSKEDGRELWRKRLFTGGRVRSTRDRVIVLARKLDDSAMGLSATKYLMCFDSQTGEPIYERLLQTPEEDFSPAWASYPVVGKEHVVFAESGLLAAFRMSDGGLAWSYKYKAELYEPTIVGNGIAVASADGNLLMFDDVLPVV